MSSGEISSAVFTSAILCAFFLMVLFTLFCFSFFLGVHIFWLLLLLSCFHLLLPGSPRPHFDHLRTCSTGTGFSGPACHCGLHTPSTNPIDQSKHLSRFGGQRYLDLAIARVRFFTSGDKTTKKETAYKLQNRRCSATTCSQQNWRMMGFVGTQDKAYKMQVFLMHTLQHARL